MGIYSTDVTTYPQTQAQWDADSRILPPNVVAVVTDGANIGRKKWFDDVHTFAELDYTDAASGGGITALTGDVTASGSGSVAATLASVGPGAGAIAYPASITLDAKGRVTDATAGTPPAIPLDARWAQILNAGSTSAGEVEANSDADATAVTSITFHKTDAGTNDQSAWFTQMRIGGLLKVKMTNNDGTNASGTPVVYRITAVPTLASDQYTIAVAYVSGQFIGSLPYWYVSYAGNEQTQWYNGAAVQLQEATFTGVTDGAGRFEANASGAPYSWTNIRAYSAGCDSGSAFFPSYLLTAANVLRVQMWDTDGNSAPADVPVIVTVKGI